MSFVRSGIAVLLAAAALAGCQTATAPSPTRQAAAPAVSGALDNITPVTRPVRLTYRPFSDQTYQLKTINEGVEEESILKINAASVNNRIVFTARNLETSLRMLAEPSGRIIDFISNEGSRDDRQTSKDMETALRMLVPEFVPNAVKSGETVSRFTIPTDKGPVPVVGTLQGAKAVDGTTYGVVTYQVMDPKTNQPFMDIGHTLFDGTSHFPVRTEYKIGDNRILFTRL